MSIHIQLPKFEGPLGLLLYLIRKEEMDIFDININQITKQYLEFIKLMKELDLEVAGEFVAMAATLIHIKSRMLLPQYDENGEVIETEDPRKELVQRLIEYQKYQEAAKTLYERPLVGRDVWLRGFRENLSTAEEEIVLEENALFSLISAFRTAMRSAKKKVHQVGHKAQSIASRILEIRDRLIVGQRVVMRDLITTLTEKRRQVLITFLSVLELGKMGFVSVYQNETYGDIYIEAKREISEDVLSRVEEYNNVTADQVAQTLLAETPAEEFVLTDAEDKALQEEVQPTLTVDENGVVHIAEDIVAMSEDAATDDEILAAERELSGEHASEALSESVGEPTEMLVEPQEVVAKLDFVEPVPVLEEVATAQENVSNLASSAKAALAFFDDGSDQSSNNGELNS